MDTIIAVNQPAGVATTANEARASAVSWGAISGGAFVAAALSVALLALGAGLGLSSVSPWSNAGASAATVGAAGIVWLVVMQAIASGMGGYVAGRLRTKWVNVHTDEVFFRDTAHGFLVWAVGLVVVAAFLTSAAESLLGTAVQSAVPPITAAAGEAARTTDGRGADSGNAYFVDSLLRTTQPAPAATTGDSTATRGEVGRIFAHGLRQQTISPADKTYLGNVIAARTGLSQADAERRVDEVMAQAKNAELEARQAADTARKAAAHLSLWMFLSFLIGAFCASYAATIGGRQRDEEAFARI